MSICSSNSSSSISSCNCSSSSSSNSTPQPQQQHQQQQQQQHQLKRLALEAGILSVLHIDRRQYHFCAAAVACPRGEGLSIFGGDDFKLESSLRRLAAQVSMASMESMAMVALVQCDGNGSICFNSAAKAHVACTVPRITNHATTFGIAHSCSLWSHDCHRSASWPTTVVCRGQSKAHVRMLLGEFFAA